MCHDLGPVGGLSLWCPVHAGVGCGPWALWLMDCGCCWVLQLRLFIVVASPGGVCGLSVVVSVDCILHLHVLGAAGVIFQAFVSGSYIMTGYSL